MKKSSLYYTYFLIDPRTDEVAYVGKGVRDRMQRHSYISRLTTHHNPKLKNKILKLKSLSLSIKAEKVLEHEDEILCHLVEIAAIAFYGRTSLCNLTDGGEGTSGMRHSEESKKSIGEKQSGVKSFWFGKKQSPESNVLRATALMGENNHNFGKAVPPEVRDKISASLSGDKCPWFGKTRPQETRDKMSAAAKSRSPGHKAKLSEWQSGGKAFWSGKKQPPEMVAKRMAAMALTRASKANKMSESI